MASLLSGAIPWGSLIFAGVLSAGIGTGSWYVTRAVYQDKLETRIAADAQAKADAVKAAAAAQHAQDLIAQIAAVAEAVAQKAQEDARHAAPSYIVQHVRDTVVCVPYGVVRSINHYANGADPASIAPGQSDDACAPVPWRSLTGDLSDDYITGNENAEQLNRLEDTVRKQHATVPPAPVEQPSWFQRTFGGK